jgi:hypothetical protein
VSTDGEYRRDHWPPHAVAIQHAKEISEREVRRKRNGQIGREGRVASSLHIIATISMHTASRQYSYSYTTQLHNFPPPRKLVVVHRQDVVRQCDRLQWPCKLAYTARSSDVVFPLVCCGVVDSLSVHCCVPAVLLRCCGERECTLLCSVVGCCV